MADGDTQELKLHIVTDVDPKGFQGVSDGTKKITVDTNDLSDATKRSLGMLPPLQQQLKKSGEAAAESAISHRELRRVLDEVGNVAAPGAGAALGELAMGPLGAALALVGAFELLKDKIAEANDEMDKFAALAAQPQTGGIKAVQDAWRDATAAQAEYDAAMRTAGQDNDPVATRIKDIKAITAAQIEASKQVVEAYGREQVAYLRAHGGTAEQITAAENATKAQLNALDSQNRRDEGSDALKLEQSKRQAQADDLAAAERAANAAKQAADKKAEDNADELKKAQDKLNPDTPDGKKFADRKTEAEAALNKANALPDYIPDPYGMNPAIDNRAAKQVNIDKAQDEQEKLRIEEEGTRKRLAQLKADAEKTQADKDAADDAAKRAAEASQHNKDRLGQLPDEIRTDTTVEGIKDQGSAAVAALNSHLGNIHDTVGQQAAAAQVTAKQINGVLQGLLTGDLTQQQFLIGVQQRIDQLNAQMKALTHNTQ